MILFYMAGLYSILKIHTLRKTNTINKKYNIESIRGWVAYPNKISMFVLLIKLLILVVMHLFMNRIIGHNIMFSQLFVKCTKRTWENTISTKSVFLKDESEFMKRVFVGPEILHVDSLSNLIGYQKLKHCPIFQSISNHVFYELSHVFGFVDISYKNIANKNVIMKEEIPIYGEKCYESIFLFYLAFKCLKNDTLFMKISENQIERLLCIDNSLKGFSMVVKEALNKLIYKLRKKLYKPKKHFNCDLNYENKMEVFLESLAILNTYTEAYLEFASKIAKTAKIMTEARDLHRTSKNKKDDFKCSSNSCYMDPNINEIHSNYNIVYTSCTETKEKIKTQYSIYGNINIGIDTDITNSFFANYHRHLWLKTRLDGFFKFIFEEYYIYSIEDSLSKGNFESDHYLKDSDFYKYKKQVTNLMDNTFFVLNASNSHIYGQDNGFKMVAMQIVQILSNFYCFKEKTDKESNNLNLNVLQKKMNFFLRKEHREYSIHPDKNRSIVLQHLRIMLTVSLEAEDKASFCRLIEDAFSIKSKEKLLYLPHIELKKYPQRIRTESKNV